MVLWVPLTSHCYLEDSGLLSSLSDKCCASDNSTPTKDDPCDEGCKLVEKAAGKIQNNQRLVVPALVSLSIAFSAPAEIPLLVPEVTLWPSETLHLVQFVARTALPPRAPSSLS